MPSTKSMKESRAEICGWTGKILRVNLTKCNIDVESSRPYTEYAIGGRGIGQLILLEELKPQIDALDPGNKVILSAGPLVGTLAPTSCRMSLETLSPITGGITFSNMGGHLAPELKFAGFDAVVIEGEALEPSVLFISDEAATLESTPAIWGRTTFEAEDFIHKHWGRSWRVMGIGPAGENLVRSAALIGEKGRAAGRGGVGAVLGSKRLKAIAIRGMKPIRVARSAEFLSCVRNSLDILEDSPKMAQYREGGTIYASGAGGPDYERSQATKNYRDEFWSLRKSSRVREPVFRRLFEVRRLACFNCPIFCSHFYRVNEGPYAGIACEGLQTNTLRAFTSNLDIDQPDAVVAAQCLCSQLGIDVDMAAATIAWSFDLYERGILTSQDTEGLELTWGNAKVLPILLHQIAHREGFGGSLSDGVYQAALELGRGSEDYAIHIKKADVNEQGMRWNKSWAFGIVTSTKGGGHLDGACWGITNPEELAPYGLAQTSRDNELSQLVQLVVWHEKFKAAIDALGLCYFITYYEGTDLLGPEDVANLYSTATGHALSVEDLLFLGERIHNMGKAFNTLHAGFNREDDYPPKRLVQEPIQTGPHTGKRLNIAEWDQMLDAYYDVHGWDRVTGWQTRDTLQNFDLGWVADKLGRYDKLP